MRARVILMAASQPKADYWGAKIERELVVRSFEASQDQAGSLMQIANYFQHSRFQMFRRGAFSQYYGLRFARVRTLRLTLPQLSLRLRADIERLDPRAWQGLFRGGRLLPLLRAKARIWLVGVGAR